MYRGSHIVSTDEAIHLVRCNVVSKMSVTEHGGSWKRMYFERLLWRLVENFVPRFSDPEQLVQMADLGGKFVRRLEISELMPPVVRTVTEPTSDDDVEEGHICIVYCMLLCLINKQ